MNNPVSTYRIQFHKDFTLADLDKIIPYLQQLGIGSIYASPILEAAPGSLHGYNGLNPHRINPEIGTEQELIAISKKLKEYSINWMQDIAPNHMAFHQQNKWLVDVLQHGKDSDYASYFDILWDSPIYEGKLMVPFEGSELAKFLEDSKPKTLNYQICNWQETDKQINYRRFFIVNDLICLNMQNHQVFEEYHRYIKYLYETGILQGLRIDHIDGLFDPSAYLHQLRQLTGKECYTVVEKILEYGENMPNEWPVQGNTGYDFMALVNNLFTNMQVKQAFTDFYTILMEDKRSIAEQIAEKKSYILYHHMQGELDNLHQLFHQLKLADKAELSSITPEMLKETIGELLIQCPLYRYYGNQLPLKQEEAKAISNILALIKKSNITLEPAVDLLEHIFLIKPNMGDEDFNSRALRFYQRSMQFTGPLMAKGVEDTLMYTYNNFIGHNEVGDSPENFGISKEDFHALMIERQREWPLSLNASATHDTKRGEDARARLNVLTDLKDEWFQAVEEWYKLNTDIQTTGAPDVNDEYFIYQSLIACYPMPENNASDFSDRFTQYLTKAMREAKRNSNWANPNETYENATRDFSIQLLNQSRPFWKSFEAFHRKIAEFGIINSLSQLVLKVLCPGVPDIYQGCELWDLSFVDPDNRRPVDYQQREEVLNAENMEIEYLWLHRFNGQIKLWLLHILLKERRQHQDLFKEGTYIPLETKGTYHNYVIAFARNYKEKWFVVALPLNIAIICKNYDLQELDWNDTVIVLPKDAPQKWKNILNRKKLIQQKELPVKDLFNLLPAALLINY